MNIKNYILIGFLSCFLLNTICLYSQTSEQKGVPITQLKAKKRVVEQLVNIYLETQKRIDTSNSFLFMSIIQESEITYKIIVSSSGKTNSSMFWLVMANWYRFQPFIGKWKFKSYDVFLYGNGIDYFLKPYRTTIISDKLFWITSLKNHFLYIDQPNEFDALNESGETILVHYDYSVLSFLYNKRKISVIPPPPFVYSYDDLTEEENKYYMLFLREDTLTLKQFKSKIRNKQY